MVGPRALRAGAVWEDAPQEGFIPALPRPLASFDCNNLMFGQGHHPRCDQCLGVFVRRNLL